MVSVHTHCTCSAVRWRMDKGEDEAEKKLFASSSSDIEAAASERSTQINSDPSIHPCTWMDIPAKSDRSTL